MEREKLLSLVRKFPDKPGVYIMHNAEGQAIYIGKAKSLRRRVSSYFRRQTFASPRLARLVSEVADISTVRTESEAEALILESRMIKHYQPFFNVELKMGESYPYIKITREDFPRAIVTRFKGEDDALYIGPFVKVGDLRALMRLSERYFPLRTCSIPMTVETLPVRERPCMRHTLGRCIAPCVKYCTESEYRERTADYVMLLSGRGVDLVERLRKRMDSASRNLEFEEAARFRDTIRAIWRVSRQSLSMTTSAGEDLAPLASLARTLGLPLLPWRIDGFDISHTGGGETVGVAVVFEQGLPNPSLYRRFNIRTVTDVDDFRSMEETLTRRYKKCLEAEEPMPQLILIDGGPVQLEFAKRALDSLGLADVPAVALAKREEEIYKPESNIPIKLDPDDPGLRLLERVRDEAHRYAITSHRSRRNRKFTRTTLEDIQGIGKNRASQLLTRFGSLGAILKISEDELAEVPGLGPKLAKRIVQALKEQSDEDSR